MERATKRPDRRRDLLPKEYQWIPGAAEAIKRLPSNEAVAQYIVHHAQRAHDLLRDETFNEVYHELLDSLNTQLLNTMPGQREEREDLYYRIRGLQDLIVILQAWINRYEMAAANQQNVNVSP